MFDYIRAYKIEYIRAYIIEYIRTVKYMLYHRIQKSLYERVYKDYHLLIVIKMEDVDDIKPTRTIKQIETFLKAQQKRDLNRINKQENKLIEMKQKYNSKYPNVSILIQEQTNPIILQNQDLF